MMKLFFSTLAAIALTAPAAAFACDGEKQHTMAQVSVQEGAEISKTKSGVFVDANSKETRQKMGIIPGAVLLTSFDAFDSDKELPNKKDEKLVFYCASERCGASKAAAKRAAEAGFTNVAVLPVGIKGWKEAGLPTANVKPQS